MKRLSRPLLALLLSIVATSCSKQSDHAHTSSASHQHEHKAPHGGTPVVLGKETYHLEFVRDADAGRLTFYILDGEMENFIRVKAPSVEVVATVGGEKRPLAFKAVANTATGETVGDTSQFDAEAAWLKTTTTFDGTLTSIEIRGTKFEGIAFNFPKGNEVH